MVACCRGTSTMIRQALEGVSVALAYFESQQQEEALARARQAHGMDATQPVWMVARRMAERGVLTPQGIPVCWQGHCPAHQGWYRHHPSMPPR
jgi:hypothetical protein